ncbi:MAG: hypothetical protein HY241_12910 [Actinobacteria bacterium]|nr:hypothetical protein [Actinomycetota bacterium]
MKAAAAELMNRHQDIPSIQAFRYACGLSQDQAAARYNEVTGHQTSLGGTTVNAWESWGRGKGAGSPPTFSSLLILAAAYGRGPLGVAGEFISPGDLVAEAYERLGPEDQLALKGNTASRQPPRDLESSNRYVQHSTSPEGTLGNAIGRDFDITVPTIPNGNPVIRAFSLPNTEKGQLLDLTWETFGFGIERLIRRIKNLGRYLDVDICFGVNEAGLVMATFLASAQFGRCSVGYLRCKKVRDDLALNADSFYPAAREAPTIVICDFEVKHADVVGFIAREIRARYPRAELYFAVFGAMTKDSDLEVSSIDDLTGARIMKAADFQAIFIAATMSPPGIEPPLELR